MSFVAVIEIGSVVGDFVGKVDELGLERRALAEYILHKFGMIFGGVVAGMLDDSLPDFKSEIQAREGGVALFEVFDDAESVQVVVEGEAVIMHRGVEGFFSGVAEGWVADIVDQGQGFSEISV
jgi:hypothetical protein